MTARHGRGGAPETVQRYWSMLSKLPRKPRAITVASLESLLDSEGLEVSRRTIQRDLEKLQASFSGLSCDKRTKPYQWSWAKSAPSFLVPAMNTDSAVTLSLMESYLKEALPRSSYKSLKPIFEEAQLALKGHGFAALARWPSKVRAVPKGLPRRPPNVPEKILDAVYDGLLRERQIKVSYHSQAAAAPQEHIIHPLGLVLRGGTLLLVATFSNFQDPRLVLLHRLIGAEVLESARRKPRGFHLDSFIEAGGLGFKLGKEVRLVARVSDAIAQGLVEAPLGDDQTLSPAEEGWEKLSVTAANTMELFGWIRSLGSMIEVLKPKSLRDSVARDARSCMKLYR